jgi:pyruvate dehydrogenase E1 component beta subunit
VLVFEHKALYGVRGELSNGAALPIGRAEIVRPGTDVTVVATQLMRHRAENAADELAAEGSPSR